MADITAAASSARSWIRDRAPGLALVLIVAAASKFLENAYGGPVMLYALLLGMALNFLAAEPRAKPGVQSASKLVLRVGVALIGFQITVAQILDLGLPVLAFVGVTVAGSITLGALLARALKLDGPAALVSAGAVSICGASAALALSAVVPQRPGLERDTAVTVVGVTALSTVAMIAYPLFAQAIGLSDVRAGVFIGAAIHDVAQVVGAGYTISKTAGDTATIVKLERVLFLLPAALAVGFVAAQMAARSAVEASAGAPKAPGVPLFLVAFFVFAGARSAGLVPLAAVEFISHVARWCLVAAIAAVGVKTDLGDAFKVSGRLLGAIAGQTLIILVFALLGAWLLPLG